jgi:hypothetical protein
MPFYDYQCILCTNKVPHYRKIADRDDFPSHCDTPMRRVISAPMLQVDIQAYVSPASGKWIDSRAARREDLKREGCIADEPGLREHIAGIQASEKEKIAKTLDATVDRTVSEMHASGLI